MNPNNNVAASAAGSGHVQINVGQKDKPSEKMSRPDPERIFTFPVRLHQLLSELEANGLTDIMSWQSHGKAFRVNDKERFVKEILPMWFRQSRYTSFTRQLNLYGFLRFSKGRDKSCYWHKNFVRGKRHLTRSIKRVKIKGTGVRQTSNPDQEPDFYGDSSSIGSVELAASMDSQAPPLTAGLSTNLRPPAKTTKSQPQQNPLDRTIQETAAPAATLDVGSSFAGQGESALLQALLSPEPPLQTRLLTDIISPYDTRALLESENARLASLLLLKQAEEQKRNALLLRMHEESERQNKLLALMLQPPPPAPATATAPSELASDIIQQSRLLSDETRTRTIADQLLRGQFSGDDLRLLGL